MIFFNHKNSTNKRYSNIIEKTKNDLEMKSFFENEKFTFQRDFRSKAVSTNGLFFIDEKNELISVDVKINNDGAIYNISAQKMLHEINSTIINICSNEYMFILLTQDGNVWNWSKNNYHHYEEYNEEKNNLKPIKIDILENIKQISCGGNYAIALDAAGSIWQWRNISKSNGYSLVNTYMNEIPTKIGGFKDIIWINSGHEYFYALDSHGKLWGYGSNYFGALGSNAPEMVTTPICIFDNFQNITSVHTCNNEAYAISEDYKLLRWTFNFEKNQDGLKKYLVTEPKITDKINNIIAITSIDSSVIAMSITGELWSWGNNYHAVLGQDIHYDITKKDTFDPQKIVGLPLNPKSMAISSFIVLSVYNNDSVWGWGCNLRSCTPYKMLPKCDFSTSLPVAERNAYKKYYIAFLDILGFKDKILHCEFDTSLEIKSLLEQLEIFNKNYKEYGTNIILLSDSIVITICEEAENSLENLLVVVSDINNFISSFALRGAIAYGDLYHKNNILYGPAVISAYQLQEYEANTPRIIINPDDVKSISSLSYNNEFIMKKYFIIDDDKKIFFDYLSYTKDNELLIQGFGIEWAVHSMAHRIRYNYYSIFKVNKHVAEKYNWLLKYVFIWQINNSFEHYILSDTIFNIFDYKNIDKIVDFQNCLPITYSKFIIAHKNYILLTANDLFPFFELGDYNYCDLKNILQTQFLDTDIELSDDNNISFYKSFCIDIYNDQYEKRPIIEISNFTYLEANKMKLVNNSTYKWININDCLKEQKDLINKFLGKTINFKE